MRQRTIGSGGAAVGEVGLGCMPMSGAYRPSELDAEESARVLHRALDLGCTLLDTADVYGPFANELLLGRTLRDRRDEAVLATKCGLVFDPAARGTYRNGRPGHVRAACDDSLRRLQTDRIDLYQLHRVDPEVPLEDTWGAMADLVRAGKVRSVGLSEVTVEQAKRAMAVFPVTSVQSELSLWTREALDEVVPWCAAQGVGFLAFSPLGRGFLTGTVGTAGTTFEAGDFRATNPRFTPAAMTANRHLVDRVRRVAYRLHATPAQVALVWVLAQGPHVVPIPGTKRRRWLVENCAAADLALSPQDLADLDGLPAPVGARY